MFENSFGTSLAALSSSMHPSLFANVEGKVLVEYVWMGTSGELRNQTKVLDFKPAVPEEVPVIVVESENTYGGEAYVEACTEVYLKPRKVFRDPFRGGDHILVLCDMFSPPKVDFQNLSAPVPPLEPHPTNSRVLCENVMKRAAASAPVFAVEQEYVVMDSVETTPPACGGWPHPHLPDPTKPYYYPPSLTGGVKKASNRARTLSEAHLRSCLKAGLNITAASQGANPGVWSYKLGPGKGIDLADQLFMSRHVLMRLSEELDTPVSLEQMTPDGKWIGTTASFKFSTDDTRRPGFGIVAMQQHIGRLQTQHMQHIALYSRGSTQRLVGKSSAFTCGFGNKNASVVIPSQTMVNRAGYYVDRRPPANSDPYIVSMLLASTTMGIPVPALPAMPCKPAPPQPMQCFKQEGLLKAALSAGNSAPSGYSWGSESKATTMNTEDVLIDELEKLDRFAPDTPPNNYASLSSMEGSDECCSDGTSPDRSGFLAESLVDVEYSCC